MTYQDHLDWLIKQEMGACAEHNGFVDAKLLFACGVNLYGYSTDYEQMRYQHGYEDGKAMLACQDTQEQH